MTKVDKRLGIEAYQKLAEAGQKWRLFSWFYKIRNKKGQLVPFIPNKIQRELYEGFHQKNIVVKGRQHGVSTLADLYLLDVALFTLDQSIGIVANSKENAAAIYDKIIKTAWDAMPEEFKAVMGVSTEKSGEIAFAATRSSIKVDVSFRSGTLQYLHISEYGKVCAAFPDKANEIKTGALNTVGPDAFVIIESTAEGSAGDFYDKCQLAQAKKEQNGFVLWPMDYKFFFFPWYLMDEYKLEGKPEKDYTITYFEGLRNAPYIQKYHKYIIDEICSPGRMLWYEKKAEEMNEEMWREFPSIPDEAFRVAQKGSYYEKQVAEVRKDNRICRVPWNKDLPTYTVWDIGGAGGGDDCTIIFFQIYGKEIRIIDFYEGTGRSMVDLAQHEVRSKQYWYEGHYFPHDVEVHEQSTGETRLDHMIRVLGPSCEKITRYGVADGINLCRMKFKDIWFDKDASEKLLSHLAQYKRDWDSRNGIFKETPKHDEHSHAADSFRYLCHALDDFLKHKERIAKPSEMDIFFGQGIFGVNNSVTTYDPFK